MNATTYHFYDAATGHFIGSFTGLESDVEHNLPAGASVWITTEHVDHTAHKLCLETGVLLPHTPPAPAVDPRVDAERQILELEAKHIRALREAVLAIYQGKKPSVDAMGLLAMHDMVIERLRPALARPKADPAAE